MVSNNNLEMSQSLPLQGANSSIITINDNFIEGDVFEVILKRNSLGLGLSIYGGPEAAEPYTNLIRVKKVFPLQPAWESGMFQEGDILMSAGGQNLTGLSLRQALDVLRSSPPITTICICRPKETIIVPKPKLLLPASKRLRSYSFSPSSVQVVNDVQEEEMEVDLLRNYGEFAVTLNKINGSLGFSLRSDPDDTTALRHSVKALVKEPAISDGRIRPGDKLISANDKDCGAMSHSDLIIFLRSLPESNVVLKFYRDASRAQTPISTPTESGDLTRSHPNLNFLNSAGSFSGGSTRSKQLRYEAKEMVRSLQASRTSLDGNGMNQSRRGSSGLDGFNQFRRGSSSSRRLNRPFSPAAARKNQQQQQQQQHHYPLSTSSSSPFVLKQFSYENTEELDQPFVETPCSPEIEMNHANNPFQFTSKSQENSLEIEEITEDDLAMEIETMIEDFEVVFKEDMVSTPNRPNHLDLFSPDKHCRTSYTFKNPH